MAKAKVTYYEREDGLWDWKLIGGNGEEVCSSLQGYTNDKDAKRGFKTAAMLMRGIVSSNEH